MRTDYPSRPAAGNTSRIDGALYPESSARKVAAGVGGGAKYLKQNSTMLAAQACFGRFNLSNQKAA